MHSWALAVQIGICVQGQVSREKGHDDFQPNCDPKLHTAAPLFKRRAASHSIIPAAATQIQTVPLQAVRLVPKAKELRFLNVHPCFFQFSSLGLPPQVHEIFHGFFIMKFS